MSNPTDSQYRDAAEKLIKGDHTLDIDQGAKVSRYIGGAWVAIWIRIDDEEIPDAPQENP